MKTIADIYKYGKGPSSSHTMGPEKAAMLFLEKYPNADNYEVTLYGSLSKTGKGHLTDFVISEVFSGKNYNITFNNEKTDLLHPNTMDFCAYKNNTQIGFMQVLSIGGGEIHVVGTKSKHLPDIYPHTNFTDIKEFCTDKGITIFDYIKSVEPKETFDHLAFVWEKMKESVKTGLKTQGTIPGSLKLTRKAGYLFSQKHFDETGETKENRIACSYAFAVAEQNASAGQIVTAPTCGSAGVMPAVLLYTQQKRGFSDNDIVRALAVGGLIGNIIRTNASVSGAECGCQAEIGSACSMAAAALCELYEMDIEQIEYAAEIAMEHHLGLTCDPICGLVQIPCIERNAVAAMRAINAVNLSQFLRGTRRVSFDTVVKTMYRTGLDMNQKYKETAEGGLAEVFFE
ncbi:MAG: L-serine ammonia-lyase, iron-sulfur-dependent, subunit alpha [Clostridia bacterium]|nr:L-serine ammonia-lyase, iron-sulfur-dependent, subunit alpha [Clostridia bacterium]